MKPQSVSWEASLCLTHLIVYIILRSTRGVISFFQKFTTFLSFLIAGWLRFTGIFISL